MVATKGVPQTFNGIVTMLEKCSIVHDTKRVIGCDVCVKRVDCIQHFDNLADIIPGTKGYKRKCYRFSLWFQKLL